MERKVEKDEEKDENISPTIQRLFIIGGTGSLGSYLLSKYYKKPFINAKGESIQYQIYIYSRDENKQWMLKMQYPDVTFIIGDMRDSECLYVTLSRIKPNIVIIAGALKHVDICENNPEESIKTNILGVNNVINAVKKVGCIEVCLLISTDKACSPVNTYGMSKAIAERLIINATGEKETATSTISGTRFLCVRYGNVLNSRGSLIPKFKEIGESKSYDHFPITDDKMTRFFMSLKESTSLIHTAIQHGKNGETFIPIVSSFKISSIAKYFSEKYKKPVKLACIRPGEKIHECLINVSELYRTETREIRDEYDTLKRYYVILPFGKNVDKISRETEYTSEVKGEEDVEMKGIDDLLREYL